MVPVLSQLLQDPSSCALWIDTQSSFPAEDAFETLKSLAQSAAAESLALDLNIKDAHHQLDAKLAAVLDRVAVATCFDAPSAHEAIVRARADSATRHGGPALRFIVIDSVAKLFGGKLSAVSSQGDDDVTGTFVISQSEPISTKRPCIDGSVYALSGGCGSRSSHAFGRVCRCSAGASPSAGPR
jgi:hypothetical protein